MIIDTPPNFGLLLTAALTAASYVLIPVQAAPFALSGLSDLLQVIENARELNENVSILSAVCTIYDTRTGVAGASFKALAEKLPDKTFEAIIYRTTKLEESPSIHQPIQFYAHFRRSSGARGKSPPGRALDVERVYSFSNARVHTSGVYTLIVIFY